MLCRKITSFTMISPLAPLDLVLYKLFLVRNKIPFSGLDISGPITIQIVPLVDWKVNLFKAML